MMDDWFGGGRARPKFSPKMKLALYKIQGGTCEGCKRKVPIDLMEVDHKKAFSRGYGDGINNLQLLCSSCNKKKGAGTMGQLGKRLKATGALKGAKANGKVATAAKATTKNKAAVKTAAKKPKKKAADPWGFF